MMNGIPQYLIPFDTGKLPIERARVLVIGSGVAGVRAALAAAEFGDVLLVTKAELPESATRHAQGGIAIAPAEKDATASHIRDTMNVACGLAHADAVDVMATCAHETFDDLCKWGMRFDKRNGELEYAREGGHSHARILHADGDATGRELARTLIEQLRRTASIRVIENRFVIDLLTDAGACVGALTMDPSGALSVIQAPRTILATGGCGRLFRETTNPPESTGDGVALAFRAGADIQDMEMMQFHPTVLYVGGACRSLISEAVRGAGAKLVDARDRRFMSDYDERAELAPRDCVSRAILAELEASGDACVYLDIREIGALAFRDRFPQISRSCDQYGVDLEAGRIPVRPAAHYMIGGVRVDLDGRTNVAGLFACGEVASNGIHGANRLASNSLLEGLVFGARAGESAGRAAAETPRHAPLRIVHTAANSVVAMMDESDALESLREIMWRNVGISRSAASLDEALNRIEAQLAHLASARLDQPAAFEFVNLIMTGWLMVRSAALRTESRGVHFRIDYPERDDAQWRRHIVIRRHADGVGVGFAPLDAALCAV